MHWHMFRDTKHLVESSIYPVQVHRGHIIEVTVPVHGHGNAPSTDTAIQRGEVVTFAVSYIDQGTDGKIYGISGHEQGGAFRTWHVWLTGGNARLVGILKRKG